MDAAQCVGKFGAYLKNARAEQEMTQTEIANRAKITQAYYSYIENGERDIPFSLAVQLCEILETDLSGFMTKEIIKMPPRR